MATERPGLRVLFIDDDEDFVFALSKVLESEGFNVRHARDGEIGIRMATKDPPDLIILDFMMPTKNGFEVCRELRGMDGLSDVPILALTAFGRNIGQVHGFGQEDGPAYVQEYVEKRVEPNVLLERIVSTVARQRASLSSGRGDG